MWENYNVASSYLFCKVQQGFWKLVMPKIVFLCRWICLYREIEVLIEGMVLKIPFPLLRSPILGVMYVWRCVEQERRLQFSLLVFLWFVHSVGLRHFGLGILLKICHISAFDFAPWSSVLFYFLLSNIDFFLYKSEFLVQGWGSLFCDTLKPNVNVA